MNINHHIKQLKEKYGNILYLFFPIIIILIAFNYIILNNYLLIGDYKDILSVYEPSVFLASNPLSLWNNLWLSGMPEISNIMSDRLYPLSFPIYFIFNNIYAVNIVVILHIIIAYFAMYNLSTLITKNKEITLLTSLIYVFSGLMLSRVFAGHIFFVFAYAWIPLIYYYFAKILYLKENTIKNYIIITLLNCLLLAMGNVYSLILTYLLIAIFILYYIITTKKIIKYISVLLIPTLLSTLIMGIKVIPSINFSENVIRIDNINVLEGGGSLENNFASLILGTPIDVNSAFWFPESCALIGIVCIIFAIIGLVFGKKEIAVPSIIAVFFSLVWADGGNNLLWAIHYLPVLDNLRCPGRIFGALLPLILVIAIYGIKILYNLPKDISKLKLSKEQKFNLKLIIGGLILIKLLELPYQTVPNATSVISLLLVIIFIALLYLEKVSEKVLKYYLISTLTINLIILIIFNSGMILDIIPVFIVITLITIITLTYINKNNLNLGLKNQYIAILLISFLVISMTTLTYISPANKIVEMNPNLENSPANEIAEKIIEMGSDNSQIWAYTNGWEYYHQDFNYILMKNGIHTVRGHYPYVLKSSLPAGINIGNVTYYTADYIIDTAYLDNGNQNIHDYTFKIENISVYKPEEVLPNAFVIRGDNIISSKTTTFSPDKIIIEGDFKSGDVAILKTAYYDGWKVNGQDAAPTGNMVASILNSDTKIVEFKFDPNDVKFGIIVSIIGIISLILLIFRRKNVDDYLNKL